MLNNFKKPSLALLLLLFLITVLSITGCGKSSQKNRDVTRTIASLEITPMLRSIATASQIQLSATSIDSFGKKQDSTNEVEWQSSDEEIFSISEKGKLTSFMPGTSTITAKIGRIFQSIDLTVTAASLLELNINPSNPTIYVDTQVELAVFGLYDDGSKLNLTKSVTWKNDASKFFSRIDQKIIGKKVGAQNISASFGGKTDVTKISVSNATLNNILIDFSSDTFYPGNRIELHAIGIFSDGKKQDISKRVKWTFSPSESQNITRENNTLIADSSGEITITATLNKFSKRKILTISSATLQALEIIPSQSSIALGNNSEFTAIGNYSDGKTVDITTEVTWFSSDTKILNIINAIDFEGNAISVSTGSVTVSATLENLTASSSVSVTDAILEKIEISMNQEIIAKGTTLSLVATGIYSDNSTLDITALVTWSSDDTSIVHISNQANQAGLVSGLNLGTSKILAQLNKITSEVEISVTDASLISIIINNLQAEIIIDTVLSLEAVGIFSDGSKKDITNDVLWSYEENNVISISNNEINSGILRAIQIGTSQVNASFNNIVANESVSVSEARIINIIIESSSLSIVNNTSVQLTAIGILSNDERQDITKQVNWKSESPEIIRIENFGELKGRATAVSGGEALLNASIDNVTASITLSVTNATLSSIEVSHQNEQIANNTKIELTAIGIYSDNSRRDITQKVLWQSDDSTIVNVINAVNKKGYTYSLSIGAAIISAELDDITGNTTLFVNSKTLDALTILSENSGSLAVGNKVKLSVIGNYSDGSTLDLDKQITWQSSDRTLCTISNSKNSFGILLAIKSGPCHITARFGEVSATVIYSINAATLQSITITPENVTLAKGSLAQLIAIGNYSNNTSLNISRQVNWTSDNLFVRFNESTSTRRTITAIEVGTSNITASYQNISSISTVNVTAATLQSITISPNINGDFNKGSGKTFHAHGMYSDQSVQDISQQVLWISSNTNIATASNAEVTSGKVTSLVAGDFILTATIDSIISNELGLEIIDNPQAPISLSLKATPYVILNDGNDTSSLSITVQAADVQQNVPDNTEIDLRIVYGSGSLINNKIMTIDGKASLDYTSTIKGLITIEASIKGTEIVKYISIYVTDDFSETIGRYGFAAGKLENNLVAIDSKFAMYLINFSNRSFTIDGYRVFNGTSVIAETSDPAIVNNNELAAGGFISVIYVTTAALNNDYVVAYYLTEPLTGQQFVIAGRFKLK